MNREILFRGKRTDNGEWVYGMLLNYADGTSYICRQSYNPDVLDKYEVDSSTVGQYTGLTDKNGKKIFEWDVLRHDTGTLHEVVFERRNGHAYFGWVMNELETWHFDSGFLRQLEVIGNVHDNPELLEEPK